MRNGEMMYTCAYNKGVECTKSECDRHCGWNDGERLRRKTRIRKGGTVQKNEDGLWQFHIRG